MVAKRKRKAKPSKPKKKRKMPGRKNESLTGGTGDVNPQYLHGKVSESAADTTTTFAFPLPITRIPQGNRVTILEVLKLWVNTTSFGAVAAAAEVTENISVSFSTISFGTSTALFNEPNIFAMFIKERQGAFTAAGSYVHVEHEPQLWDFTDNAGHGVLIANDQMFVQIASALTQMAVSAWFKLLYRFKTVGITEYVGIVQSQQ